MLSASFSEVAVVLVRPARFERATFGFEVRKRTDVTTANTSTSESGPQALGALLGALAAEIGPSCPDLAAVVAAWPALPEPLRAGIVAMVKAAAAAASASANETGGA